MSALGVTAADHAGEQDDQQEPAEARKHALSQELPSQGFQSGVEDTGCQPLDSSVASSQSSSIWPTGLGCVTGLALVPVKPAFGRPLERPPFGRLQRLPARQVCSRVGRRHGCPSVPEHERLGALPARVGPPAPSAASVTKPVTTAPITTPRKPITATPSANTACHIASLPRVCPVRGAYCALPRPPGCRRVAPSP